MHLPLFQLGLLATTVAAVPQAQGWGQWLTSSSTKTTMTTTTMTTSSCSSSSSTISTISTSSPLTWNTWTVRTSSTTTSSKPSKVSTVSTTTNTRVPYGWDNWSASPQQSGKDNSGSGSSSGSLSGKGNSATGGSSNAQSSPSSSWKQGDSWYNQPAMYNVPVPTATLTPARHWTIDLLDQTHLEPADSNKIYFSTNGTNSPKKSHQMAWLSANFTSYAVLLDNSGLCTYTFSNSSNILVVTFADKSSYQVAHQLWVNDLIFVLNSNQCSQGSNCYLQASELSWYEKNMVCIITTSNLDFEKAVSYFGFEWGNYTPRTKANKSGSSNSSTTVPGSFASTTTNISGSAKTSSSSTTISGTTTSGITSSGTIISDTTTSGTTTSGTTTSSGSNSITTGTDSSTNGTTTSTNSTVAAGNYTAGSNDDDSECVAPADTKYGLPTACLGQFFDEDLDDFYGYDIVSQSSFQAFVAQFADLIYIDPIPEDADEEQDDSDDDSSVDPNDLKKRTSLGDLWNTYVVQPVNDHIVQPIVTIVKQPYTKEISLLSTSMNVPQERTLVASPWGPQVLIKSFSKTSTSNADNTAKLDIFCVDCGMQGTANIDGKVGISIVDGIDSLGATLRADMSMTLKVGVDASLQLTETFQQQLFNVPLSPFCVAGVICIGPYLKLGAELELKAVANGQILAGAAITMHNAQASVDIAQFTASASGWQPEFNPTFEASGNIDLSADFGLPLAIAIGVDVLNGKFTREAAIVDRPSLIASAAVAAAASLSDDGSVTGGVTETNGCLGISTSLSLRNDVYISIPNHDKIMVSNPEPKVLAAGCIALPAASSTDSGDSNTENDTDTDSDTDSSTDDSAGNSRRDLKWLQVRQDNTSSTTDSDIVDTTSSRLSNGSTITTNYVQPDDGDSAYNLTDGYEIATLIDTQALFQVLPCANGNLLLFGINETVPDYQCGDMWTMTSEDEVVVSDGMARIPVYYPDEMTALGVSRIRLVDAENIPVGANELFFYPTITSLGDGDEDLLYYPMNPDGTTFYPIVCAYSDGQPSKVFLSANNVDASIALLQSADLIYSITGGTVSTCIYLPLIQGNGYDDDDSEDELNGYFNSTDTTTSVSDSTLSRRFNHY